MPEVFRVWLDGQCLQTGSRMRGIGRYFEGFLRGIIAQGPSVDLQVSLNAAMAEEAVAARDFLSKWLPADRIHIWHGAVKRGEAAEGLSDRRVLSEIALAHHVNCIAPDVAISSSPFEGAYDPAVPLLPNTISNTRIASIFYDAIPFRFPQHYFSDRLASMYYQRRLDAFAGFDFNLCISDFARKELLELKGIDRSVNISAGYSDQFSNLPNFPPNHRRAENTLLYVGAFDWRKNVPAVIDAIGKLDDGEKKILKFITAGHIDIPTKHALETKWLKNGLPPENLKILGHVSDAVLLEYYRNVSAVIQPSLMEGFGLTALEAILCKTPVLAANAGALPEIVIDHEYLFDPKDTDDIARHISPIVRNSEGLSVSSKALEHANSFSWERTARIALDALKRSLETQNDLQPFGDTSAHNAVSAAGRLNLKSHVISGCLARSETRHAPSGRLIIDATCTAISDAKSGIQRVVKNICAKMPSKEGVKVVVGFSDNPHEWVEIEDRNIGIGVEAIKQNGRRLYFTEQDHILMLDSSWALHAEHARSLRNARIRGAKITTCLYDTAPLRAGGFGHVHMSPMFSKWLQTALTYSTGFVCISKSVADELLQILHCMRYPRPISVGYWPLGADFVDSADPTEILVTNSQTKKFLMVGTLEPRKGYGVALDAFELLWNSDVDVQLTIVGKIGWSASHIQERIERHPQWGKKLHWLREASDQDLAREYASSDCLIASSFAEGFGLPIVEAGHFGKPIIASDIPVFREVSSRSVGSDFFEVGNSVSLAERIAEFSRSTFKSSAQKRQSWESWEESAVRLQQVILNDQWYRRYEPDEVSAFVNPSDIGIFNMHEPLTEEDTHHRLRLIDGPMKADVSDAQKFIVAVSNKSDALWSSVSSVHGKLGIFLGCRLFDREGDLILEGSRSVIPLIIAPGDTVYMPVEVPNHWLKHKDAVVHIQMVQESVSWWDGPLVLPIEKIARNMACG